MSRETAKEEYARRFPPPKVSRYVQEARDRAYEKKLLKERIKQEEHDAKREKDGRTNETDADDNRFRGW